MGFLEQLRSHACFLSLHYSNIKAAVENSGERLRAISAALSKRLSPQWCERTLSKDFKMQCSVIPLSSVTHGCHTHTFSGATKRES